MATFNRIKNKLKTHLKHKTMAFICALHKMQTYALVLLIFCIFYSFLYYSWAWNIRTEIGNSLYMSNENVTSDMELIDNRSNKSIESAEVAVHMEYTVQPILYTNHSDQQHFDPNKLIRANDKATLLTIKQGNKRHIYTAHEIKQNQARHGVISIRTRMRESNSQKSKERDVIRMGHHIGTKTFTTDVVFSREYIQNSTTLWRLYNEQERDRVPVASSKILTDYPYYKIMDLPAQQIQYAPKLKNPCFFVRVDAEPTVALQCLPYFFMVGVPKCGTTDLSMKLMPHQQIDSRVKKEVGWWSKNKDFIFNDKDSVNLYKYTSVFSPLATEIVNKGMAYYEEQRSDRNDYISRAVSMDASPFNYRLHDGWTLDPRNRDKKAKKLEPMYVLPHKIHHILPEAKILFILREPGARALSHFNMNARNLHWKNVTQETFHSTVLNEIVWFRRCTEKYSENYCAFMISKYVHDISPRIGGTYILPGLYSIYIKKWLEVFPRKNIHFINLETYSENPMRYINESVLPFLGLDYYNSAALDKLKQGKAAYNAASKKLIMSSETRTLINQFFLPYNIELQKLLGDGFVWSQ